MACGLISFYAFAIATGYSKEKKKYKRRARIFLTIKQIRGKKAHPMQRAAATSAAVAVAAASVTCSFQELGIGQRVQG